MFAAIRRMGIAAAFALVVGSASGGVQAQMMPGIERPSALLGLLQALAAPSGGSWFGYDEVPQLHWQDRLPKELGGEQYARDGQLLLEGFGEIVVPNGRIGRDAGYVSAKEGSASVRLLGDAGAVNALEITKLGVSQDYSTTLRNQLPAGTRVELVAADCRSGDGPGVRNDAASMFYRVVLPEGQALYAEGGVRDGWRYAAAQTRFVFYRELPQERISRMHCRQG